MDQNRQDRIAPRASPEEPASSCALRRACRAGRLSARLSGQRIESYVSDGARCWSALGGAWRAVFDFRRPWQRRCASRSRREGRFSRKSLRQNTANRFGKTAQISSVPYRRATCGRGTSSTRRSRSPLSGFPPEYINTVFKTLGFLFESLCFHDLKACSAAWGGRASCWRNEVRLLPR